MHEQAPPSREKSLSSEQWAKVQALVREDRPVPSVHRGAWRSSDVTVVLALLTALREEARAAGLDGFDDGQDGFYDDQGWWWWNL